MLWINGQISALPTMVNLFLPSIVSTIISIGFLSQQIPEQTGDAKGDEESVCYTTGSEHSREDGIADKTGDASQSLRDACGEGAATHGGWRLGRLHGHGIALLDGARQCPFCVVA